VTGKTRWPRAGDNGVDAKDSFLYPLEGYAKIEGKAAKNSENGECVV
jgi:hypothetical protein